MSMHGVCVVPYAKAYRLPCALSLLKNHEDEKRKAAMWSRPPTNISKSLP